jgi:RNA polymerase primary sigma factor
MGGVQPQSLEDGAVTVDGASDGNTVVPPGDQDVERIVVPAPAKAAHCGAAQAAGHLGGTLPAGLEGYLREIGHTPLLTRAQEVTLAQRVAQGDRVAANALVQANLRLVVSVARRYRNRGLPFEDVIAEGNIGLLHAVAKYDWQRGYRFSTYAVWWIRQAITRAIDNQGSTISIPVHVREALGRRSRVVHRLANDLGREPTSEELDAALGGDMSCSAAAMTAAQVPLSLDLALGEDGAERFIDAVPDESTAAPEERAMQRMRAEETRQVLHDVLTARERDVLTLHFGLDGAPPQPLKEISRRLGVTRERVRQIEVEALGKLRQSSMAGRLQAS